MNYDELKSSNSMLRFRRDVWRYFKYPVQQEVELHEVYDLHDLQSRKNGRRQQYKPFHKTDVTGAPVRLPKCLGKHNFTVFFPFCSVCVIVPLPDIGSIYLRKAGVVRRFFR